MAVKNKSADFRTILTGIKSGNLYPAYLLMGEEAYYIDKLMEAFENNILKEEEKDFNFTVYYGQEIDIPTVIASCQQYPFMAERKLVLLKEAQSMDKAKTRLEALAEYVLRPNESNILVIGYKGDTLGSTHPLVKAMAKAGGVTFVSPKLKDYQLAVPIKDYCRSKKIGIDEKALAMLAEYVGADLGKLFGEVDKLIVAANGRVPQITPEMVEKNIGVSKDFNNYELVNALAYKNYDKSLRIISYFESNPKSNPTIMTAATLFGFFSKLMMGHFAQDKSDDGLTLAMGLKNRYALEEHKAALARYSASQTLKIIGFLREFDIASKGVESFQNEYKLLRELIFNIFSVR